MTLGQILAVVDRIPRALEDVPRTSASDFTLVANRLEHAARCVRVLAECQAMEAQDLAVLSGLERERLSPAPDGLPFEHLTGARA